MLRSRVDRISDRLHDQAEIWRQSQGEDLEAEPDQDVAEQADLGPEDEDDESPEEPVDTAEDPEDDAARDDAGGARDEAEDYEDTGEPDDAEAAYEAPGDGERKSQATEDLPARSAVDGQSRRRRPDRAASPVRRTRR